MALTAGLGTRLRPLSWIRAKPALPVAGIPLAGRILRWLSSAGVSAVVLNLHHLPATITAAIGDGSAFGVGVRYSWEPAILGSAGGPARALPLIDADRFFLVNGDTLTDLDLEGMAARHLASDALVTMALIPNPDPRHYGGVTVDDANRVTGFTPPGPDNRGWHFIGVQAVESRVFAPLEPGRPADTVGDLYRDVMARSPGSIRAHITRAGFCDIGTAVDYLATCLSLARDEHRGDPLVGAGSIVAPGAHVERTVLWDGVRVAPGARLDSCVVGDGVTIPAGTRLERCAIVAHDGRAPEPGDSVVGGLLVSPLDARRTLRAPRKDRAV